MIVGRYATRIAEGARDIRAARALRHSAFFPGRGPGQDGDRFDARCQHVLIEERRSGDLVACFRLLPLRSGAEIDQSYSAQYYDLSRLKDFPYPMVEMGRFCVAPGQSDPDILRAAWAALTRYVDRERVELLFGCTSFQGTDAGAYADAFAVLRERHMAPVRWRPRTKAANILQFGDRVPDLKRALKTMPPLLRSYLALGGWVSDHAVIDCHLNTLHVFTGLETNAIPPARAKVLRRAVC